MLLSNASSGKGGTFLGRVIIYSAVFSAIGIETVIHTSCAQDLLRDFHHNKALGFKVGDSADSSAKS